MKPSTRHSYGNGFKTYAYPLKKIPLKVQPDATKEVNAKKWVWTWRVKLKAIRGKDGTLK